MDVAVLRNGQEFHFTMTPIQVDANGQKTYRVGFGMSEAVKVEKLPFTKALSASLQENKKFSLLMVELIHKMVEHKASIKQTGWSDRNRARLRRCRPAARLDSAAQPDGDDQPEPRHRQPAADPDPRWRRDHVCCFVESLMRRDISLRIKERIYQTAFVFIVLVFVVVIYNDLMKALPGLAQRLP